MIRKPKLILAALTLAAAAMLLTACLGGSPQKTTEDFYRAVEAGEITKAMGFLTEDSFDTVGRDKIRAALEMQTRRIADQGGIEAIEIVEEEVHAELADLRVEITLGDGTALNETVQLRKVDGDWKIESRK